MIIQPKVRGFICTNAHPKGCAANVKQQIDYVRKSGAIANGPKNVLVIGASTGYGLASRITAAFGCGAKTLGVFFEKEPDEKRTGTAGWYNSAAFHRFASAEGLYARHINGDAFSDEIKQKAIETIKADMGKVDLVIYSLASPRRQHPKTGMVHNSVLKPIGKAVTQRGVNTDKQTVDEVTIQQATEDEIANTVAVMGGEDWEMWMDALLAAGVLAEGCRTAAYTYLGEKVTWDIYWHGTIGAAKKDLDRARAAIDSKLAAIHGKAYVSVLKALVTQASAAIPIMPLYLSLLYRIMKEKGGHEGCIEQIDRLFREGLCNDARQLDAEGRLRVDDKELRPEIQDAVEALWPKVTTENLYELTDFQGYKDEFLRLFGFGFSGVDYDEDLSPVVDLPLV
ncbi:MAG TPA: trans-2-enoyl-CoA reductase family protein [Pseudomonadales bacterium]|nr:trans-2-enoyl-CoA reductase family protein [Pseudomonadales bacterium]